jgi:hypothetical protein
MLTHSVPIEQKGEFTLCKRCSLMQEPKSMDEPKTEKPKEADPEPERDRRGLVLPARQRVGGIITPQ